MVGSPLRSLPQHDDSEPDPRVFFASERTLLAWVRTGLAAIGFVACEAVWKPVSSPSDLCGASTPRFNFFVSIRGWVSDMSQSPTGKFAKRPTSTTESHNSS